MTLNEDRSASLLLRVWLEDGADGFRARLTSVDTSAGQVDNGEPTVGVASSPADAIALVQTWLAEFLGPGGQADAEPS